MMKDSAEADHGESEQIFGVQKQTTVTSTRENTLVCSASLIKDQERRFLCRMCHRFFATNRGLSQHLQCCRKKSTLDNNASNLIANGSSKREIISKSNLSVSQALTVRTVDLPSYQSNSNFSLSHSTLSAPSDRQIPYSNTNFSSSINGERTSQEIVTINNGTPELVPESIIWGNHTRKDLIDIMNAVYDEIVYWRQNLFMLPNGAVGKGFLTEMTRLLNAWNDESENLKDIAIKAIMVMPALLLQKPSYKSKAKHHSECLKRRLHQWTEGDFDSLIRECRTIQAKILPFGGNIQSQEHLSKTFAKLMLAGKVNSALRLLDNSSSSGILGFSEEVLKDLTDKHSPSAFADSSVLMTGEAPFVDSVMFENIKEETITRAALHTKGAAGPSGVNADGWQRMLVSKNFGKAGNELKVALARLARILCRKKCQPRLD